MVRDSKATSRIIAHCCSTPECKIRQSTPLHATRRNQGSSVVRRAVLAQPVSNPLAFPGSPHATLRFPKLLVAGAKPRRVLPRAGAITSRFESLEKLWRRRDERTSFGPSRRDSDPCLGRDYVFVGVVARYDLLGRERVDATKTCS